MENAAAKCSPCPTLDNRRRAGLTQRHDIRSFGDIIHFQNKIQKRPVGSV